MSWQEDELKRRKEDFQKRPGPYPLDGECVEWVLIFCYNNDTKLIATSRSESCLHNIVTWTCLYHKHDPRFYAVMPVVVKK
jgi:hypothetical protein